MRYMRYNTWGLKQHTLKVNCHAWFHLCRLCRALRNEKQVNNSKLKICFHWKIEPIDSRWKHIFILNILLATRYSQLGWAHANEIKQNNSPVLYVVLQCSPRYDWYSYKCLSDHLCINASCIKWPWCSYLNAMIFMKIEPILSDLLSYVTLFLSSPEESHKTGLTEICISPK